MRLVMTYKLPPGIVPEFVIDDAVQALAEVLFNVYGCIGIESTETFEQGRGHWLGIAAILVKELEQLGWARPEAKIVDGDA